MRDARKAARLADALQAAITGAPAGSKRGRTKRSVSGSYVVRSPRIVLRRA